MWTFHGLESKWMCPVCFVDFVNTNISGIEHKSQRMSDERQ
jgi:hypothetical protein